MKNIIQFVLLVILITSVQSLFAKKIPNKQQVFVQNNYGKEVAVFFEWNNDSVQKEILKNNQKIMMKPATSKIHLRSMHAVPLQNLNINWQTFVIAGYGATVFAVGLGLRSAPIAASGALLYSTSIIIEVTKAKNNTHIKNTGKLNYFIVEQSNKSSKVKGQKEIKLKGYESEQAYFDEFTKKTTEMMQPAIQNDNDASSDEVSSSDLDIENNNLMKDINFFNVAS